MNCAEFQEALPEDVTPKRDAAFQEHLSSCSHCSMLVSDLDSIAAAAPALAEMEEPGPRIWLQIEAALKSEGLIRHQAQVSPARPQKPRRRWLNLSWAVPLAAAVVLAFGYVLYQPSHRPDIQTVNRTIAPGPAAKVVAASNDDQDLLEVVGEQSPSMRAEYAANLKNVNAYIHEAEETAKANPDDEQAQESVMNAYEQRSMLYEMAMDRSLP
jgi:hypothetical protein